jgi:hypothetical protein
MSNWAIFALCLLAAFVAGGTLGYLTAAILAAASRADDEDRGGFR